MFWFALMSCCYVILYLGLVRLLILLVRRAAPCGLFLGLLLHAAALLLGVAAPLIVQWMVLGEPARTSSAGGESLSDIDGDRRRCNSTYGLPGAPSLPAVPTLLVLAAAIVLLANTIAAAGEVRFVRERGPNELRRRL